MLLILSIYYFIFYLLLITYCLLVCIYYFIILFVVIVNSRSRGGSFSSSRGGSRTTYRGSSTYRGSGSRVTSRIRYTRFSTAQTAGIYIHGSGRYRSRFGSDDGKLSGYLTDCDGIANRFSYSI